MSASGVRYARVSLLVHPVVFVLVLPALLALAVEPASGAMLTERASVSSAAAQAAGSSGNPRITPDGRFVVFDSAAANLVAGDTNGVSDIFVRDRLTGTTTRVNLGPGGVQAVSGGSYFPSISDDGRFVAFESDAANLVVNDTNGARDVFLRDRQAATTMRVSRTVAGDQATGGASSWAVVSGDGNHVVYASEATNLIGVGNDTNGSADIFVYDRQYFATSRVSEGQLAVEANGPSSFPSISADGRYVAYQSLASNLVPGDTNGTTDIFVRDRRGFLGFPAVFRVSISESGGQVSGYSSTPSISADGRYVAYASGASTIVEGDTNHADDVFVFDRWSHRVHRASVSGAGVEGNHHSAWPAISSTGRYVAFRSFAFNLVAGDTNGSDDVFVHDTLRRTTRRASVSTSGVQGNAGSYSPGLAFDGRRAAFESDATNLVTGDTNGQRDVFVQAGPSTVTRVAGRTRFSTALAIAEDAYPNGAGVNIIIASGDDRAAADPLAASGLCWAYESPMLLVSAARTPDEVKAYVKRVAEEWGSVTLHVVGGPVSVPDARLSELVAAGGGPSEVTIDRILSTGSRYDLAAAIARRMKSIADAHPTKTMPRVALFANGADANKFFDALALSPISAATGAPILLVSATSVPVPTANAIDDLAPTTRIVGGGPLTIAESVRAQLGATRWAGRTRYDTAIAIAEGAVSRTWLTRSYAGLATKLPDALTGGSLMGRNRGVLLLTDGTTLTSASRTWLGDHKWDVAEAYVFGGVLSISESVVGQVRGALQ